MWHLPLHISAQVSLVSSTKWGQVSVGNYVLLGEEITADFPQAKIRSLRGITHNIPY